MYKKNTVNYVDVFWKLKFNEYKSSKRKSSNLCSAIKYDSANLLQLCVPNPSYLERINFCMFKKNRLKNVSHNAINLIKDSKKAFHELHVYSKSSCVVINTVINLKQIKNCSVI